MKIMKQLAGILLALAITLGLLAGCGAPKDSAATSDSVPIARETATPEQTPEVTPEEPSVSEVETSAVEEPEDLTVSLPLTTGGESYSYFVSYPGILSNFFERPFFDYPAWIELEKRTGVHIEWEPVSVEAEMETFNLMLTSGDYVDMFASAKLLDSMDYYVEEGVVWDLKEQVQEYMPNYLHNIAQYPELEESIGSESDSGYWSVLHNYTKNTTYQGGLVIRKDWLDQLELELPQTVEEYHDVLTRFKTELGADAALWINSSGILNNDYFSSAFGISAWYNGSGQIQYPIYQVDGEVKYGPAEEGYRKYLETMAQWYREGLIYQDFMSYTSSNTNAPQDIITNGDCGVFTSQLTNMTQYDGMVEGIDVVAAYIPVESKGDTVHVDWTLAGTSTDGLCISTAVSADDLPLLLKMWDYCCSEEGSVLQNYGVEGETYTVENGEPKLSEMVTNSELPAFSLALNVYTLGDMAVGIIDKTREQATYSDKQLEAIDRWKTNVDDAYNLPSLMSLNAEETAAFNEKFSDILTYVNTFTLSVIIGNAVLDDAAWDGYRAELDGMELDTCIAQYQAAYDRYMAR